MSFRQTVRSRAIKLTVVEVNEILDALNNSKASVHLDGRQRQLLDDATESLTRAMDRPVGDHIEIPIEVAIKAMRCIAMTQRWYESMFAEFGKVELD